MDKIIMLVGANIRKSKSQAVSLLIFVLIAVMFLNIGLVLYFDFGDFFDKRAEELHTPHAAILQAENITTPEQAAYLEKYPGVTEMEQQNVLSDYGEIYVNGAKTTAALIYSVVDEKQRMNPPSLIGESLELHGNAIYVPYFMKVGGGYSLGDDFKVLHSGKEHTFSIAGFTEELPFGTINVTIFRFYVSDECYTEYLQELPRCVLQSVRMDDNDSGFRLTTDYAKEFFFSQSIENVGSLYIGTVSYDGSVKQSRTFLPSLVAILVIAFAIILLVVSLIVIRFRILNSIEEDMTNIGALKAMGYQNHQIIGAMALQFGSVALAGGLLGIATSKCILPMITRILESQIAMIWNPALDVRWAGLALGFVCLIILLLVTVTAGRIGKLHPLIALRGGVETHCFRKNNAPLDKAHGPLDFLLAVKQLAGNKNRR